MNSLREYHVENPGLPPCIAHDLFEGFLQYDLLLVINYFVVKKTGSNMDTWIITSKE